MRVSLGDLMWKLGWCTQTLSGLEDIGLETELMLQNVFSKSLRCVSGRFRIRYSSVLTDGVMLWRADPHLVFFGMLSSESERLVIGALEAE
tara:strand:+ start:3215 stop:3487 length:273 start_codon:yes stop_codon:yes gene_type:complete